MNTILALRGRGNIGKSTTIGILFQLLKNNGFEVIMEDWFGHEKKEILAIISKNDKKIGISSRGDNGEEVSGNLNDLIKNNGCTICVTACRSYGKTNTAIFEYKEYAHKILEKEIDETGDTVIREKQNRNDAQRLIDEINKLV